MNFINQRSSFYSSSILRKIATEFGEFMSKNFFSRIFSKFSFLFLIFGMSFLLSGCGTSNDASLETDPSLMMLQTLFGSNLRGSLLGSFNSSANNPVFATLIHAFNTGLMGGALLIFSYIAVVGTIYTAQDGIFLGKKWSKTFIPLRAVFGVIAVFPVGATGFGIAQYIIYAMTYAGVGLANSVWGAVADSAKPGGISPGIPESDVSVIYSALGDMVFYQLTNNLLGGATSVKTITQSNVDMTKEMFKSLGTNSSSANGGASVLYDPQSGIITTCKKNNPTNVSFSWCDELGSQIQANINNSDVSGNALVGNISYLVSSPNGSTSSKVGDYVQSQFKLNFTGQIAPLPPLPQSMSGGNTSGAADPVSTAYQSSVSLTSSLMGVSLPLSSSVQNILYSSDSSGLMSLFLTNVNAVVTDMANYQAAQNPNENTGNTENFSASWWNAGDEYLYLDRLFAQEAALINQFIGPFAKAAIGSSQSLITIQSGGVYANLEKLSFAPTAGSAFSLPSSSSPSISNITSCGGNDAIPLSNSTCSWIYYAPQGNVFLPLPLTQNLSTLLTYVNSSGSSYSTQGRLAALDFICKLGGGCPANPSGDYTSLQTYLGGQNPSIGALDLSQGPFPAVVEYINYYFTQKMGVTPPEKDIAQFDLALNYVDQIYKASQSSNLCKDSDLDSSACNQQTADVDNPMVISGQDSPDSSLLGKIFYGLMGSSKEGTQNISGLMAQIWCVGEVDFGHCISQIQNNTPSSGFSGPQSQIVTSHFSVIANAQWVGMNLIGGSVSALTGAYSNFTSKMDGILTQLQNSTDVSTGDMAAAAVPGLGGIFAAKQAAHLVDKTTAATVAMATASLSMMWMPVVMIVLTALFTTGVMFAVFIPMLPFVLFWAGKVTWLLLVVEAMFAAPLMALAMAYPEGHDLWGMGEQGFKISLNLLLFPVLMICGLVVAMTLTYLIMSMTASPFHYVSMALLKMAQSSLQGSSITGHEISGTLSMNQENSLMAQGIMSMFLIFMYATIISMAFNKSFSTIYVIPERVMSWIGSQGMKFGEKEAGEMQQAVSKQADQAAQGGGQATSQGMQSQKAIGDAGVSQAQQSGQAEIQVGSAIGQGISSSIQTISSVVPSSGG
jgi:hypothetical protein